MCGIVGFIGKSEPLEKVLKGIKNLEYRGYDSAGIAYLANGLNIIKSKGKISVLDEKVDEKIKSSIAFCHTRWATHGEANDINSHPHKQGEITIVHNGILENYQELKDTLLYDREFLSETDTEVIAALLDKYYKETNNVEESIKKFMNVAKGSYALIIYVNDIEKLYIAKKDSPLILGLAPSGFYVASDVPAILEFTNKYILLNDKEYGVITKEDYKIYNINGCLVEKEVKFFTDTKEAITKNGFEHFMLKEIFEEETVVKETFNYYLENFDKIPDITKYKRIDIVGCGSTYNVSLIGKSLIEEYLGISVNVDIASEYRYKRCFLDKESLGIFISQSGETADTLAAVKKVKEYGPKTLGIINVLSSSIAREVDEVLYTKAGIEIAVATTKAYVSQLIVLVLIVLKGLVQNKKITTEEFENIKDDINKLPILVSKILNKKDEYKKIAKEISNSEHAYYIGRGIDYALTMEASLKLKEVSYIHSESYAAGELKHGTISLVEEGTPVLGIITDENLKEKTLSNLKETKSRGAKVILFTTLDNNEFNEFVIKIPKTNKLLQSILAIIPIQLIAYLVAYNRECDIDKPKNLAKSVTVE